MLPLHGNISRAVSVQMIQVWVLNIKLMLLSFEQNFIIVTFAPCMNFSSFYKNKSMPGYLFIKKALAQEVSNLHT